MDIGKIAAGGLHCLSAFGLFGTMQVWVVDLQGEEVSSLPFGFWSVWDWTPPARPRPRPKTLSSLPFGFWSVWDARR